MECADMCCATSEPGRDTTQQQHTGTRVLDNRVAVVVVGATATAYGDHETHTHLRYGSQTVQTASHFRVITIFSAANARLASATRAFLTSSEKVDVVYVCVCFCVCFSFCKFMQTHTRTHWQWFAKRHGDGFLQGS